MVDKHNLVLIGKFSHGRPSLTIIKLFFTSLKLQGNINVSSADPKHIYIECSNSQDFNRLWLHLAWVIDGFVMRVFKWGCDFSPLRESAIAPVWIRIEGLPLYLFEELPLLAIAYAVGKPMCIDKRNLNRSLLSCARICVELDISKPLIDLLWIEFKDTNSGNSVDGFWVNVYYDVLPRFCAICKHIGHSRSMCKRNDAAVQDKEFSGKVELVAGTNYSSSVDVGNRQCLTSWHTVGKAVVNEAEQLDQGSVEGMQAALQDVVLGNNPAFTVNNKQTDPGSHAEAVHMNLTTKLNHMKDVNEVKNDSGVKASEKDQDIDTVGRNNFNVLDVPDIQEISAQGENSRTVAAATNSGGEAHQIVVKSAVIPPPVWLPVSKNVASTSKHSELHDKTVSMPNRFGVLGKHQNEALSTPIHNTSTPEEMELKIAAHSGCNTADSVSPTSNAEGDAIKLTKAQEALNGLAQGIEHSSFATAPSWTVQADEENQQLHQQPDGTHCNLEKHQTDETVELINITKSVQEKTIDSVVDVKDSRSQPDSVVMIYGEQDQFEGLSETVPASTPKQTVVECETSDAVYAKRAEEEVNIKMSSDTDAILEDSKIKKTEGIQGTAEESNIKAAEPIIAPKRTARRGQVKAVSTSWAKQAEEEDAQITPSGQNKKATNTGTQTVEHIKGILGQGPFNQAILNKFSNLKYCDEMEKKKGRTRSQSPGKTAFVEPVENNIQSYDKTTVKKFHTDLPIDFDPLFWDPYNERVKWKDGLEGNVLVYSRSVSPVGRTSRKLSSLKTKINIVNFLQKGS